MRAQIFGQGINLYKDLDLNSSSVALDVGTEVELGKGVQRKGLRWVEVTTPDGQRGYMLENVEIFQPKTVRLYANRPVDVYEQPSTHSEVKSQLEKYSELHVESVLMADDVYWVKIRDGLGQQGFIRRDDTAWFVPRVRATLLSSTVNRPSEPLLLRFLPKEDGTKARRVVTNRNLTQLFADERNDAFWLEIVLLFAVLAVVWLTPLSSRILPKLDRTLAFLLSAVVWFVGLHEFLPLLFPKLYEWNCSGCGTIIPLEATNCPGCGRELR